MTPPFKDQVIVERLDLDRRSMLIRAKGRDRAGVIAQASGLLESEKLYVDSITFNLVLPRQDRYEMEILAKGDPSHLQAIHDRINAHQFLETLTPEGRVSLYWPTAYMLHLGLNTPDREGIIAHISEIVRLQPDSDSPFKNGSFTHLIGMTHNSGGPEGGTAYFSVRANIASQSLDIQSNIEQGLHNWAKEWGIEKDLWLRDLNP